MLFNSFLFLALFLPAVFVGFLIFSKLNRRLAVMWLGAASLVFYMLGSPMEHTLLLLGSIAANWFFGRAIVSAQQGKKFWLTIAIIFNLSLLGWFKYSLFIAGILGASDWPAIVLPLGISFYTFTQIAYLVDEYRKPRPYHPIDYFLFVTYFPHLIAGPILNHAQTIPQFEDKNTLCVTARDVAAGISIFAIGLFKKCVIADHFAIYADQVFGTATSVPSLFITEAWFGALSYTLQIYFDFSAYSDMAVGISLLFGIRLPQNFNSPYQATSIIDFWRRWHISLSNFLRDYLYIPLGGNRKGPARRYINLLLTMVLGGLWHGAGWTFLLWGGLHGVYLCANHAWQKLRITLPRLISFAITFMAVVFAWVVFRAENLQTVAAMLKPMVAGMIPQLSNLFPYFSYTMVDIVWLASGLLSVWLLPNIYQMFGAIKPALPPKSLTKPALPTVSLKWAVSPAAAIVCALTMAIGIAAMGGYSPFLYFRF